MLATPTFRSMWRQGITQTLITVGSFTLLAGIAYGFREYVLARGFGTNDATDAFVVAWAPLAFMISVIAGSIASALVPTYIDVRENQGPYQARALASSVFVIVIVVLTVMSISLVLGSNTIIKAISPDYSSQKQETARTLLVIMSPMITISGASAILAAVLNANRSFVIAAASASATPMVGLVFLVFLSDRWGITALAIGSLLGSGLEASVLLAWLSRKGLVPRFSRPRLTADLSKALSQYAPVAGSAFVMGGILMVDQIMAASLGDGDVAVLAYGTRLVSFFIVVAGTAMTSVFLPHFAQQVAVSDWTSIRDDVRRYMSLILAIAVPATVAAVVLSEPIVRMLFEGGVFTAADTQRVTGVQKLLLLEVPSYLSVNLLVRVVSALRANSVIIRLALFCFILKILLNVTLMNRFGVSGIALATAIVYLCSALVLWITVSRLLDRAEGGLTSPCRRRSILSWVRPRRRDIRF